MQSKHYTAIARNADGFSADVFAAGYLDCFGSDRAIAVVKHDLPDRNVFQVMYFSLHADLSGPEVYAQNVGGNPVTSDLTAALAEYAREVAQA